MTSAISHRGPDDSGFWTDRDAVIGLGHRRLAIMDLTSAGHQPMASASGRYVISYNGEIYNFRELRQQLEGTSAAPNWRGHSDTEVVLACIEKWGVAGALARLNGMFAFAVWDRQNRILTLARDRLGEKPLYYGRMGSTFLFGSELKSLVRHPEFERSINPAALTLYLRHNYVPAPHSIWQGVRKLPPGCFLEVRDQGRSVGEPTAFWDLRAIAEEGVQNQFADDEGLVDELETLLKEAVALRMEADVPLGAFLSGGIDSSTIVALMQAQSSRPVRTFTIGFHEQGFNEAVHAKAVAAHLGTDHTELYVSEDDALALVPRLPAIWDEPFSDSSQIPTYLVSELTRRHVTVSLSGDGGDELFGGYARYFLAMRIWESVRRLPLSMRKAAAAVLASDAVAGSVGAVANLIPKYRTLNLRDRLPKAAGILGVTSSDLLYRRLISHFDEPGQIALNGIEGETALVAGAPLLDDFRHTMMYYDSVTYLPDDILAKVDRASMAVSLESRVPFLDHRVVEFAWRVPLSAKFRHGKGKAILRDVLARYVPGHLIERPKMGFGVPIDRWMSGALRPWAEELLDEKRLREEGYFNPAPIRRMWDEHVSGKRRWHYQLWDILMFQAWHDQYLGTAIAREQGRDASLPPSEVAA